MLLKSNYQAPRYSPEEWFADTMAPPKDLRELATAIEHVARNRSPGQDFSCHEVDRRHPGYDPFPKLARNVVVLQLDRNIRIVDSAATASPTEIRLCDVPKPVRRNRNVGDPWFIVEAFILLEKKEAPRRPWWKFW